MASYTKKIPVPGKTAEQIYTAISTDIDRFLSKTPLGNYDLNRDEAKKEVVIFSTQENSSIKAPHFVMEVREQLAETFGEDMIEEGGLKITTTLDYELQQKAEKIGAAVGIGSETNFTNTIPISDLTLEGVARINIEKLEKRYKDGFSSSASINRQE